MRSTRVFLLLAAAFLTQSVMAQPGPPGDNAAFGTLVARVEALEANAPNSSVAGRVYCRTRSWMALRGGLPGEDPSKQVWIQLRRDTATFLGDEAGGTFAFERRSLINVFQEHFGEVRIVPFDQPLTTVGTYTQTGTELALTFGSGDVGTAHVSRDGSLIYGAAIAELVVDPFAAGGVITESTLIEIDPAAGAQCAVDAI